MAADAARHPKVFISYSHDSEEHRRRVRALADRLVSLGVDCALDDYVQNPPMGWQRWMNAQVREADFVVMVCTETYSRRVEGREPAGRGAGVTWEGALITQEIYDENGHNDRFIPVMLSRQDRPHVPAFMRPYTIYDLSSEKTFQQLLQRLHSVHLSARPPLGPVPTFTEPPTPPQPEPRSANVQLRREITDLDRDRFLRESFNFIAAYFERSLKHLAETNSGIDTDFIRVDTNRFQAGVYRDGQALTKCTIWLGDRSSFAGGIAYTGGYTSTSNSWNETLSVGHDGHTLFLTALMAGVGFRSIGEQLSQEEAAEYYWSMLIGNLT